MNRSHTHLFSWGSVGYPTSFPLPLPTTLPRHRSGAPAVTEGVRPPVSRVTLAAMKTMLQIVGV